MLSSAGSFLRRRWPFAAGFALVLVAAAVVLYLTWGQRPGDVVNKDVPFTAPQPAPPKPKQDPKKPQTVSWPLYGLNPQRTRYLSSSDAPGVKPPFKRVWSLGVHNLMEFQPVIWKGTMFFVKNNGTAYAVRTRTGRILWKRRIGSLAASAPAWHDGWLYITTLSGRLTAMRASDGRIRWAKNVGSRTESSPLILRNRVYFGSENGTFYALDVKTGRTKWTYHAGGVVTAGAAYSNGLLYFGDYGGNMQAVRASNGSLVWKTHTAGLGFGRSGGFYGTPAVAFGRVYAGNLDRKVYSFSARSGKIAWTHSTGHYVYAAAAVPTSPSLKPTVYIGSYDGTFYALDARSGSPRWTFRSAGPISGAGSVIGRVVYFSSLNKRTYGLDLRSGRVVFTWRSGSYNPAVSDGVRLYLTGRTGEAAFEPRTNAHKKKHAQRKKHRAQRHHKRKK